MASYKVSFSVEGARLASVEKKIKEHFPEALVQKVEHKTSRADRLAEAESFVDDAKSIVEELKDEMEQWRDSIPENLQGGDKYAEVEQAEDELSSIVDSLESVDFSGVSFPGMF